MRGSGAWFPQSLALAAAISTSASGQMLASLTGTITTSDGRPVAASMEAAELQGRDSHSTRSDSLGQYRLRLPPGTYRVRAHRSGVGETADTISVEPGEHRIHNFQLARRAALIREVGMRTSKVFNVFDINYFATGLDRIGRPRDLAAGEYSNQVKFRIAVRYQVLGLGTSNRHTGVYVAFVQNSFWHLYESSAPFLDNNYNPQVFLHIDARHMAERWLPSARVIFEHESNGRAGQQSRSWSRVGLGLHFGHPKQDWLHGSIAGWTAFGIDAENRTIRDTNGRGEITLTIDPEDRGPVASRVAAMNVRSRVFGSSAIVNSEINMLIHPHALFMPRLYPSVLLQYFHGQGENLLNHSEKHRSFRLGLAVFR